MLDAGFDMTTAAGEAMAGMLAVFAQFERRLISERTRAGLAVARANGWDPAALARRRWSGSSGKRAARERRILKLRAEGLSQREIAAALGLHKETVARALRRAA